MFENFIVENVTENAEYYFIGLQGGQGFSLEKKWGAIPKKDDTGTVVLVQGTLIRGVVLDDNLVFYKTDEVLAKEHEEYVKSQQEKQEAYFVKNKNKMDEEYESLPPVFKKRIDRFRKNNPKFRVKFEKYELFCCREAVKIAEKLQSSEEVLRFEKLPYEEQIKEIPILSKDHSGNTFGCACYLAYWYLKSPEVVPAIHGALSVLVGSQEYGDIDILFRKFDLNE